MSSSIFITVTSFAAVLTCGFAAESACFGNDVQCALQARTGGVDMVQKRSLIKTASMEQLAAQPEDAEVGRSEVEARAKSKLKVAFAVFVTDIGNTGWEDGLRVLAYGIKTAARKSRHDVHLVALSPERLDKEKEKLLKHYGFKDVLRKPVPVPASLMTPGPAREHMERQMGNGQFKFQMDEETIKYWGIAMTEYDRVLVLDADFMVLDPMDDLMEADADFLSVYDHGLDAGINSAVPPAQGGFLLFRPSKADFNEIKRLTKEADWKPDGTGWKGSRIGYCYGGVGPDGLLAYYYNKDALATLPENKTMLLEGLSKPRQRGSRMHAVQREVYDLVLNDRLLKDLANADKESTIAGVKSVHFTGDCVKPWTCFEPRDWLCKGMIDKWWKLRADAEEEAGLPATPTACNGGQYTPMIKP